MHGNDETQQPDSITIVEGLLEQLSQFDLTPDDRAAMAQASNSFARVSVPAST